MPLCFMNVYNTQNYSSWVDKPRNITGILYTQHFPGSVSASTCCFPEKGWPQVFIHLWMGVPFYTCINYGNTDSLFMYIIYINNKSFIYMVFTRLYTWIYHVPFFTDTDYTIHFGLLHGNFHSQAAQALASLLGHRSFPAFHGPRHGAGQRSRITFRSLGL